MELYGQLSTAPDHSHFSRAVAFVLSRPEDVKINEILARYIRQVVRALLDRFGRRLFIVTRPLAGWLSDRYGETAVVIPALMVTIAALIALSLSSGLWGLLGSAALYGIGFGSAHPVLHAATIRLAGAERIGAANATYTTAVDLGIDSVRSYWAGSSSTRVIGGCSW